MPEEIDREEHLFLAGERALATRVLQLIRHSLPDLDQEKVSLVQERARALPMLRELGRLVGDNDWDDNLHLADILDKHILDHLLEGSGATVVPNDPHTLGSIDRDNDVLRLRTESGQSFSVAGWVDLKPGLSHHSEFDITLAERKALGLFMAAAWLDWVGGAR